MWIMESGIATISSFIRAHLYRIGQATEYMRDRSDNSLYVRLRTQIVVHSDLWNSLGQILHV